VGSIETWPSDFCLLSSCIPYLEDLILCYKGIMWYIYFHFAPVLQRLHTPAIALPAVRSFTEAVAWSRDWRRLFAAFRFLAFMSDCDSPYVLSAVLSLLIHEDSPLHCGSTEY
jgi:hypothetical protein